MGTGLRNAARMAAVLVTCSLAWAGPAAAQGSSTATFSDGSTVEERMIDEAVELIDSGRYIEAVGLLEKALKAAPKNADAWSELGFAYAKLGKLKTAEQNYHRALKLDPYHIETMSYLGELYIGTGRPEQARALLDRIGQICAVGCEARSELEEALVEYELNHAQPTAVKRK